MYKLLNLDNLEAVHTVKNFPISLVYADVIYENKDLSWLPYYWDVLNENGIMIVQTDYHTVAEYKLFLDSLSNSVFVNWCIYINEWGGTPRKGFPRKHDDILIYAKGEEFKWYKERIEIPKVTAGTAFDKKGTGLKTPCDVFYDKVSFSTVSKERVKVGGKNIQWQKPLWLMSRLLLPFTDEGDWVVDPFMGSGTTGVWCNTMGRNFIGIEANPDIFSVSLGRVL